MGTKFLWLHSIAVVNSNGSLISKASEINYVLALSIAMSILLDTKACPFIQRLFLLCPSLKVSFIERVLYHMFFTDCILV